MKIFAILVENTKTKQVSPSGFKPCPHEEACTLMSKMTNHPWRRVFLKEIP